MTALIDRTPIDSGFLAFLQAVTQRPGDLCGAPDDPRLPYFIVYPIDGPEPDGSMMFPAENAELVYQVTSVGGSPTQCQMMGDRVWKAVLERDAHGFFKYPLVIAGVDIQDRRPNGGQGGLDRETGGPAQENVVVSLAQRFVICASA
jgi:hypothetical protein